MYPSNLYGESHNTFTFLVVGRERYFDILSMKSKYHSAKSFSSGLSIQPNLTSRGQVDAERRISVNMVRFRCQTQISVLKSSACAELHRGWLEIVMSFHNECGSRFLVSERQCISWMPFENTKEGHIEDLKDLSCVLRVAQKL
jgi:hypothetical protein